MRICISIFLILLTELHLHAQVLRRDWMSYYGGELTTVTDIIYEPVCDCIYIAGYTADSTGIATPGSHKSNFTYGSLPLYIYDLNLWHTDAFLVKVDKSGNRIWGTYIGGLGQEMYLSIAADSEGNIYVNGKTRSVEGIATVGAYESIKVSPYNQAHYLIKFDSSGHRIWGTYINPSSIDSNNYNGNLCIDKSDNIYVTGSINNLDPTIATSGTHQNIVRGDYDIYIAKFDKNGMLKWCTYYGGDALEFSGDITAANDGSIYVSGTTNSANHIATPGTFQPTATHTIGNGFLSKWDSATGNLVWGTYIHSSRNSNTDPICITTDSLGYIYMIGDYYDTSIVEPVVSDLTTPGTHSEALDDIIIMKFDHYGGKIWGSYYGGNGIDYNLGDLYSILYTYQSKNAVISKDGSKLYVNGSTKSTTGIDNGCGYIVTSGKKNGFITEFNTSNGTRNWGSYYDEVIHNVAIVEYDNDKPIELFMVSRTSIDSLATPGSHLDSKAGLTSAGLFGKFTISCPLATPSISYSSPQLTVDGDYESYTWYHNGVAVSSGDSESYTPGADTTGYYYAMVEKCGCTYYTDTFYFDDIGIRQLDFERHFRLYPNPTTDQVRLEVLDASTNFSAADIQVHNLLGQLQTVQISQPTATNFSINMQLLPAGTYLLQVRNTKGIWTKQVVKW